MGGARLDFCEAPANVDALVPLGFLNAPLDNPNAFRPVDEDRLRKLSRCLYCLAQTRAQVRRGLPRPFHVQAAMTLRRGKKRRVSGSPGEHALFALPFNYLHCRIVFQGIPAARVRVGYSEGLTHTA